MTIGTRSVLYGAHCFFIHPFFVAAAWWRLYGFPRDPRLWVAFFVHDLGYWGRPNMDGPEGEAHPFPGARIMSGLFDRPLVHRYVYTHPADASPRWPNPWPPRVHEEAWLGEWGRFTLLHSRFLARRYGERYSRLCAADKLAVALEPWWLYLPRVILSGEIREYMAIAGYVNPASKYAGEPVLGTDTTGLGPRRAWHRRMTEYCRRWAYEHRYGKEDRWTPSLHVTWEPTKKV